MTAVNGILKRIKKHFTNNNSFFKMLYKKKIDAD